MTQGRRARVRHAGEAAIAGMVRPRRLQGVRVGKNSTWSQVPGEAVIVRGPRDRFEVFGKIPMMSRDLLKWPVLPPGARPAGSRRVHCLPGPPGVIGRGSSVPPALSGAGTSLMMHLYHLPRARPGHIVQHQDRPGTFRQPSPRTSRSSGRRTSVTEAASVEDHEPKRKRL